MLGEKSQLQQTGIAIIIAAASLIAAILACGPTGSTNPLPPPEIISPKSGETVAVNGEVIVQASVTDPKESGIVRIDLQVNDVTVDVFETGGPQAAVVANLRFVPNTEGAIVIGVIAFREDGTSSPPTTIALSVVGMTQAPPTDEPTATATTESPDTDNQSSTGESSSPTDEPTVISIQAKANVSTNIREAPGPGCPIIGVVNQGETITLYKKSNSPTTYWYETDHLGPDDLGWVYHEIFTLLEDDSVLPVVKEYGCLYCGDGTCSAELDETCDSCETDCGACCGNGTCEPGYGEACNTCELDCGSCCGNGTCEAEFDETCDTCEADCGVCPYCGDGKVNQEGEECDGGGCDKGYECTSDCVCVSTAECGNYTCEPGEDADNCPQDCVN